MNLIRNFVLALGCMALVSGSVAWAADEKDQSDVEKRDPVIHVLDILRKNRRIRPPILPNNKPVWIDGLIDVLEKVS